MTGSAGAPDARQVGVKRVGCVRPARILKEGEIVNSFDRFIEDFTSIRAILWVCALVLSYFGVLSFLN